MAVLVVTEEVTEEVKSRVKAANGISDRSDDGSGVEGGRWRC